MKTFFLLLILILPALGFSQEAQASPPLIIEAIKCVGNTATDCSFIQSKLYLSPGDEVDEEEISNAMLRLSTLPIFNSANIYLKKGSERGGTPLISQSRAIRAENVIQTYSNRLEFFRRIRRQLDPYNRLLSPFLAQFAE